MANSSLNGTSKNGQNTLRKPDPSPSFRFQVKLHGGNIELGRFTECSGLEFETKTFDYQEGGLNSHVHRFPTNFVFTNITLKRGIALDGKLLWEWIKSALRGDFQPYNITIILYDVSGQNEVRKWTFSDAYPIKWSSTTLSGEQNAIAVETLVLAHQGMLPDRD